MNDGARAVSASPADLSNGLELRTWVVEDSGPRIAQAMERQAESWALPDETKREALKRNGLRLLRIRPDQLDALLEALGGATMNVTAWHGQIPAWRMLIDRSIASRQLPIALEGRVRPADADSLRLLVRGWTTVLEDGPYYQLQLVPQLHSRVEPALLPRLSVEPAAGQDIASANVDVLLEPGWAYVLTGEAPGLEWNIGLESEGSVAEVVDKVASGPDGGHEAVATSAASPDGTAQSPVNVPSQPRMRSIERTRALGPEALTPPTVGQMLFDGQTKPPSRGLFIFIPRIPQALFAPAPLAVDAAAMGSGPALEGEH